MIPSPSVKIQSMAGKHCCNVVNKLSIEYKKFVDNAHSNFLPLHLKQTFPPIIWIFTEGDGIKFRLPFKIFSTLFLTYTINEIMPVSIALSRWIFYISWIKSSLHCFLFLWSQYIVICMYYLFLSNYFMMLEKSIKS